MISEDDYIEIGLEIGKLVGDKQIAYGDSFTQSNEIIKVLYPNGISVEQYPYALAVIRIIDKLFRIANKKDAFGESPFRDIAGYAILSCAYEEQLKNEDANKKHNN